MLMINNDSIQPTNINTNNHSIKSSIHINATHNKPNNNNPINHNPMSKPTRIPRPSSTTSSKQKSIQNQRNNH